MKYLYTNQEQYQYTNYCKSGTRVPFSTVTLEVKKKIKIKK